MSTHPLSKRRGVSSKQDPRWEQTPFPLHEYMSLSKSGRSHALKSQPVIVNAALAAVKEMRIIDVELRQKNDSYSIIRWTWCWYNESRVPDAIPDVDGQWHILLDLVAPLMPDGYSLREYNSFIITFLRSDRVITKEAITTWSGVTDA